jgi:uracil-DNA glycosylase family 4
MPDPSTSSALLALLAWYRDMGVDHAVGNAPVDWLGRGDASAPGQKSVARQAGQPPPPTPRMPVSRDVPPARPAAPASQFQVPTPDAALTAARDAARHARSMEELAAALVRFEGCTLKATAKNTCFFRGAAKARLMLIGEAPGRDEDLAGQPFVGRAGQLLDKMLAAIGLDEQRVHITNIVYWRPPGNRTPTPQEAQVCRPFLERQIELAEPELLVLLGGAAAKHVLEVADGIMRIRGKMRDLTIGTRRVRAIATLHPAYLLRTPAAKRLAWRDLLAVKAALEA